MLFYWIGIAILALFFLWLVFDIRITLLDWILERTMFLGEFHHPFLSHEQVVILIGFFMAFLFCYLLVFIELQNKKDWFQWSIDTYTKQLAMTENMFIRILSIVNIILQIHDAELWQQLRLRRPQSWICYLT